MTLFSRMYCFCPATVSLLYWRDSLYVNRMSVANYEIINNILLRSIKCPCENSGEYSDELCNHL